MSKATKHDWRPLQKEDGRWAVRARISELGSEEIAKGLSHEQAHLIAAAPDLFEALDALLRMVDDQSEDGMFQSAETVMARDAICRAIGEDASAKGGGK